MRFWFFDRVRMVVSEAFNFTLASDVFVLLHAVSDVSLMPPNDSSNFNPSCTSSWRACTAEIIRLDWILP